MHDDSDGRDSIERDSTPCGSYLEIKDCSAVSGRFTWRKNQIKEYDRAFTFRINIFKIVERLFFRLLLILHLVKNTLSIFQFLDQFLQTLLGTSHLHVIDRAGVFLSFRPIENVDRLE